MTEKNENTTPLADLTPEEFEKRAERHAGAAPRLVENAVKVVVDPETGVRTFVKNDSPAAQ